jgi:hypothetical protein
MRITVDLPNELLLEAEARAAEQGRTLNDLVAAGLRLQLEKSGATQTSAAPRTTQFPIIKSNIRLAG